MTKDEALKMALDWFESGAFVYPTTFIIAIKEALAQPEQEPVTKPYAYEYGQDNGDGTYTVVIKKGDLGQIKPAVYDYVRPKNAHKDWPIKELFDRPQPKQKPVAWMCAPFGDTEYEFSAHQECENCVPCYTTPPKREWVGLTDEHIGIILNEPNTAEVHQGAWLVLPYAYAYAIEAKLKEKNT